ncbi:MAG TPA: hypothetical protein VFW07_13730 [Parafilimonas sp.]|nr:hypothetical protein [Parafilimonas sp.]
MFKNISARDKNISVRLTKNRIDIINDEQLTDLVTKMPEAATDELVSAIKEEYHDRFNKDFDVTNASMAVEIWGHVFAEKFANALRDIAPVKLLNSLAVKISSHCEVINIGKKDHDSNRIVWDLLAAFKPAIAAVLLKND